MTRLTLALESQEDEHVSLGEGFLVQQEDRPRGAL